jgi:type VI secretion system secreted protein Hcp
MAASIFLKVDGVSGESKDSAHSDWIELESFSWGASQAHAVHSGGGGGAGKADFQDLSCVARMDKAFPTLFKHCATGKHFPKVELHQAKAGGDKLTFLKIELNEVLVTHASNTGTSGAESMTNFTLNGSKLKISYIPQSEKGAASGSVDVAWDIKKGV